MHISSYTIGR
ncbi:hypothetical protein F383_11436 [Gossypium arboreum]|uniref:Uncharacterized protein n=1 Tax=Gossypium arboreum TaxID=29729 RepID=A0A0B0PPZ7_GOSAR|nr:hypothetical protein F383_15878 [Gossypium arboreum]KHG14799.1 hypothetical protein F383_17429 [Gossypium arboreum]KHG25540.1 hypothetical protein F383_03182 [Gossypium arboreum]KHG28548.1 hypothetical protein F383_11436 [Gossypium arboreum]